MNQSGKAGTPSPLAGEGARRADEVSPRERDTENTDHVPNFTSHCPIKSITRTRTHARALRAEATDAERALLRLLRDHRLAEMKWRRQVPVGIFIVDFVCFEHRLIVECDGSQHVESRHDDERDAWLRAQDFKIVRFWNYDVMSARSSVIDTILAKCCRPW